MRAGVAIIILESEGWRRGALYYLGRAYFNFLKIKDKDIKKDLFFFGFFEGFLWIFLFFKSYIFVIVQNTRYLIQNTNIQYIQNSHLFLHNTPD